MYGAKVWVSDEYTYSPPNYVSVRATCLTLNYVDIYSRSASLIISNMLNIKIILPLSCVQEKLPHWSKYQVICQTCLHLGERTQECQSHLDPADRKIVFDSKSLMIVTK